MELSDILSEDAVLYCTGVKSKPQLLKILSDHIAPLIGQSPAAVLEALSERESLGSTGLGNGIAIPHGKIAGHTRVRAVFARLDSPIDFDAVDDEPVDVVMALLAPIGAGAEHLRALSLVARLLRTQAVVDALRRTEDPGEIYELVSTPLSTHKAA